MGLMTSIRDVAERALFNVGFPIEERVMKEQAVIADYLGGEVRENRYRRRQALTLSEIHEVVYGCIRAISSAIAEIPVVLHKGDTIVEDKDDPVMRLIEYPNETMGRPQLMLSIAWMLMASGNSFTEVVFRRGKPVELWPIIADEVNILVGRTKRIDGYEVRIGNEKVPLRPEEVWHNKLFNPRDGYFGLSPIAALENGLIADIESVKYNKSLYENMAVPLGVLKSEYDVPKNKAKEIIGEWNEQLRRGAGSVAFLGRGMSWQAITIAPKDIYYIQSRNLTRRQVQTVYGCSDLFLGEAGATPFAGSISAIRVFYENTIFPLLGQIQYSFNNHVMQWFDGYWIEFDRNRVPFLMEMLREKAQTHADLLRAGVTQKEIWPIVWNRPCPLPDDLANISYVPGDIIPAGTWNQSIAGPPPERAAQAAMGRKQSDKLQTLIKEVQKLSETVSRLQQTP